MATAATDPAKRLDSIEQRLDRLEGLLRMISQIPELREGTRRSALRLIADGTSTMEAKDAR